MCRNFLSKPANKETNKQTKVNQSRSLLDQFPELTAFYYFKTFTIWLDILPMSSVSRSFVVQRFGVVAFSWVWLHGLYFAFQINWENMSYAILLDYRDWIISACCKLSSVCLYIQFACYQPAEWLLSGSCILPLGSYPPLPAGTL